MMPKFWLKTLEEQTYYPTGMRKAKANRLQGGEIRNLVVDLFYVQVEMMGQLDNKSREFQREVRTVHTMWETLKTSIF